MMRVTKDADYGMLLLTHLASHPEGLCTARELAEEAGLPQPTVTKLLKVLNRAGLLQSHRGLRGGYRLARSADQITVLEVIRAVEGPIAITQCSDFGSGCDLIGHCPMHCNWQVIDRAVREALSRVTLRDMADDNRIDKEAVADAIVQQIQPKRASAQ